MLTKVENVETRVRNVRRSLERTEIGGEVLVAGESLTIGASATRAIHESG